MSRLHPGQARLQQQAGLAAARRAPLLELGLGLVLAFTAELVHAQPVEDEPSFDDPVEEMIVIGDPSAAMDVLAGSSLTRILTDERLREGAQIDELLAETPGIQIRRFGGIGERFDISIRGSRPEQVPVFLDGFRLDTSLTGRSDLSTLCLDVLQEIQVTRGAAATRSGSGAIGGVVNLVSRRPRAEPETRLRASAGDFDSYEGSLRHARRIGAWDLSVGYCGFTTEGDFQAQQIRSVVGGTPTGSAEVKRRINNDAERHTGLTQIGRQIGSGSLRITQLTSYLDRGSPGFFDQQRPDAREKNLSLLTGLRFEHPVDLVPRSGIEIGLSHRFEGNEYRDPDRQAAAERIDTDTDVHAFIANLGWRTRFDAFSGKHAFGLLAEGRGEIRQSSEATSKSREAVAVRAELETSWLGDRLYVSPSVRLERYSDFDLELIPALVLRAEPLSWLILRGSISRSYRAPSFQELYLPDKGFEEGNPNLSPEDAWSYEAGLIIESPFESSWLQGEVEFVYFAGEIDDSIVFQLVSPTKRSFVNSGPSETHGYELMLRWRPHPWVRISASRTVTRSRLDRTGEPLAGVAASQTDGRIELGPRERFKLVAEVHYIGRIPLDSGGFASIPSRTLFDASAGIDLTTLPVPYLDRLGDSLWLSVRGRNLSNESQYDSGNFPRPGRNFVVALESVF